MYFRFLRLCGYGLQLDRCAVCESPGTRDFTLSVKKNGLLCGKCSGADSEAVKIDGKLLDYFRKILKLSGEDIDGMDVPEYMDRSIEHYCSSYLSGYIHRPMRTRDFYRALAL